MTGLRPASPPARQPITIPPNVAPPNLAPPNMSNNATSGRGGSELQEKIHSKLQQLEALQYQLTKQVCQCRLKCVKVYEVCT